MGRLITMGDIFSNSNQYKGVFRVSMCGGAQEIEQISRDGSQYSLSTGILPPLGAARSNRRIKLPPFIISPYGPRYRFFQYSLSLPLSLSTYICIYTSKNCCKRGIWAYYLRYFFLWYKRYTDTSYVGHWEEGEGNWETSLFDTNSTYIYSVFDLGKRGKGIGDPKQ